MNLHLTPEMLAQAYDFLRATPPIKGWGLPHSDKIEFRVTRDKREFGHYCRFANTDEHWIAISSATVTTLQSLFFWMAHEMIHLYQGLRKLESKGAVHNADFRRRAKQICQRHGWDLGLFV